MWNNYDIHNQTIASAEFFVCEPKNILLPFLKYYLLSEATLRQTKWILSGSNYPRLDEEDFFNLKVVIPEDIEEQKRILKLLNKEKEKFDRLRQKAEEKRKESKVTFEKLLMKELT
ncbi:MAG: restriction endonuclease subunit S [Bacteroidia bacterium]|nr:restriction endonuclease subunit S [Bacteroidia bacterium]